MTSQCGDWSKRRGYKTRVTKFRNYGKDVVFSQGNCASPEKETVECGACFQNLEYCLYNTFIYRYPWPHINTYKYMKNAYFSIFNRYKIIKNPTNLTSERKYCLVAVQ